MQVGTEEDEPGQATHRGYWISNGSAAFVEVADQILGLINEVTPGMTLKYNKRYIRVARDGIVDNFVQFRPRRDSTIVAFRIPRSDEASALVDDSGVDSLEYDKRRGRYRLRLGTGDVAAHRDLLLELVRRASKTPPPGRGLTLTIST